MAIVKCLSAKSNVRHVLQYVQKKEKTEEKITSGINCNPETAKDEMNFTKELHGKQEGRQYYHVIQSFKPNEVTPEKAHEIGKELAQKKFEGYECVVVTHTDKDHVHNHIVINSVNKETGRMYHSSKQDLRELKQENDRICKREGLSVPEQKKNRYFKLGEVKTAEKGESLKFRLMNDIDRAKEKSFSKDEFIKSMEKEGYSVNWTDTRKYITYTMPEGKKFRDKSLPNEYSKEVMEHGFREAQEEQRTESHERGGREEEPSIDRDFKQFFGDKGSIDQCKSKSNDRNGKLYDGKERNAGLERKSRGRQKSITRSDEELRRDSKDLEGKQHRSDKQSNRGIEGRTESTKERAGGDRREFQEVTARNKGRTGKDKGTGKAEYGKGIEAHFESGDCEHISNGDSNDRINRDDKLLADSKAKVNQDKDLNREIMESVRKDLTEINGEKEEVSRSARERENEKDIKKTRYIDWERGL